MRDAVHAALASLVLATASPAPAAARRPPSTWSASLGIEEAYNDNLQGQAETHPQGQPATHAQKDFFTTFTAHAEWQRHGAWWLPSELSGVVQGRVYHDFPEFNTSEIRPEATYTVAHNDILLRYGFIPRRLLFADEDTVVPGDRVFYKENSLAAGLGRRFGREKRLRAKVFFAADWDDYFPPDSDRDSFTQAFVGDARYFLFPFLAPMVGGEYASRNARRANHDRDEASVQTGFDAWLPRGLLLRFRYERSSRNYTVSHERDPAGHRNSNFGRKERLDELQTWLTVPVPQLEGIEMRLRYRFRTGERIRPRRPVLDQIGDVNEVGLEVKYVWR